jgi:hypothetical protein
MLRKSIARAGEWPRSEKRELEKMDWDCRSTTDGKYSSILFHRRSHRQRYYNTRSGRACMGHIRDLSTRKMKSTTDRFFYSIAGVDLDRGDYYNAPVYFSSIGE